MPSVDVFFIAYLYEWNLWMFASRIFCFYINGIYDLLFLHLSIWMNNKYLLVFFAIRLNMNGICTCFLPCIFIWKESPWMVSSEFIYMNGYVNIFSIFIYMNMHAISVNVFFIDYLYEWNVWMFVSPFLYMYIYIYRIYYVFFIVLLYEWICTCFLHCLFVWMESVNVVFFVFVKGNIFLAVFYMNRICECVLRHLFIWMDTWLFYLLFFFHQLNLVI